VRVRVALLSIEAKLAGLNLLAMCVLSPVLPVTLAYFVVYFAVFHKVSAGIYTAMLAAGAANWRPRWPVDAPRIDAITLPYPIKMKDQVMSRCWPAESERRRNTPAAPRQRSPFMTPSRCAILQALRSPSIVPMITNA